MKKRKHRQAVQLAVAKAVLTCCILVALMALPALAEGNGVAVWWLAGAVLAGNRAAGVLLKDRERRADAHHTERADEPTGGAEPRPYRVKRRSGGETARPTHRVKRGRRAKK